MNKYIIIKIEVKNYDNLLLKLNKMGIIVYDLKRYSDYILIKINNFDYDKIKKYLPLTNISIYEKVGILKLKDILKRHFIFFISLFLGVIILICLNKMIFKIEVKTQNKNIDTLIRKELIKNNLGRFSFKVSHSKVEKIVKDILNNNKNILEWLEIKYDGLILIVNVTEKREKSKIKEYSHCNLIAKKDAKIIGINIYRGVALKEINDYVTKNEIIISGDILKDEEIKNITCAQGEVYGEVWYKVNITLPLIEHYDLLTGKERYNLNIKINDDNYYIFKHRIKKRKEKITNIYRLNDFEINLVKEKEYVTKIKKLSIDEGYKKALKLAIEKIKLKLNKDENILLKKVLKKDVNNSTIYLEIFIVTKENIGQLQIIKEN